MCDQQDTERPVYGSPAEGMCIIARQWLQFVDVVGQRPLSDGMCCTLITLDSEQAAEKKATSKKGNTEPHLDSRLQAVCNQNWTIRSVSGTRAEGMCMTKRQWLLFVDVVGQRPLSGMRF